MNKVILGLILAVCLLGMALVALNERLGRKSEAPLDGPAEVADAADPRALEEERRLAAEVAARARGFENSEAREALAPPRPADASPMPPRLTPPGEPRPEPEPGAQAVPKPKPAPVPAPEARPEPRAEAMPERAPEPRPEAKPEPRPAPKAETKPEPKPRAPERAEAPKAQEKPAAKGARVVNKFVVYSRENGATVRVGGAAPMQPKSMLLENPDRLVIDLNGEWELPEKPGVPKNDLVSGVRVGKTASGSRLVLDLKAKPRVWRLIPARNSDGFDVRVDK